MINSFSKYGRSATALPSVGGKTFFVSSDSEILVRLRAMFSPDEEGVVRVYSSLASLLASDAIQATRGDKVIISEHHTETISAAAGIDVDLAGVEIIGLGSGDARPVFTFGTSTSASFDITGAGVKVRNIIGLAGIDGLTKPFNVTGNGCELDITWKDASSTVEAVTAVRLDTADNVKLNLVYKGFTAGNAVVRAVAIDDCDNVDITIDGYGVVSTAWVNMVDVASTNVTVRGRLYTSGITNFTRDVVDTITGSTWDAVIFDASAGAQVSGGSAAALAVDDVATVAASVTTVSTLVGTADSAVTDNLHGKIGTDTQMADHSLFDLLTGTDAFFVAGLGYRVATATPTDIFDGTSDKALFTVSGGKIRLTAIWVEVSGAAIDNAASNLTFSTNPTVGTDLALTTNLDIDSDEVGSLYSIGAFGSATTGGSGGGAPCMTTSIIVDVGTICIDTSADVGTGGALGSAVMYYMPLEAGATVAAAF